VSCRGVLWLPSRGERLKTQTGEFREGGRGFATGVHGRSGGKEILCDQLETVFCTFAIILTWTVGYDDALYLD